MFGARIIGDAGATVLNENFKCFALARSEVVFVPNDYGPYRGGEFTFRGQRPYLAVRPLGADQMVAITQTFQNSDGSFTSTFYATSSYIQCYVFDVVGASASNGFGLKVWNAAGQLTYDSDYRYASMVDMMVAQQGRTRPHLPGTVEAALFCSPGPAQDGYSGGYQLYFDGVQLDGQQLNYSVLTTEVHDTSEQGSNNTQQASFRTPGLIAIFDVTGF